MMDGRGRPASRRMQTLPESDSDSDDAGGALASLVASRGASAAIRRRASPKKKDTSGLRPHELQQMELQESGFAAADDGDDGDAWYNGVDNGETRKCPKEPELDATAQAAFKALGLEKKHVQKLWRQFWKVDHDGNGSCNLLEFLMFFNIERTTFHERAFALCDLDGSGLLDFPEFVCCLWNICTMSNDAFYYFVFDLFDVDGSGELELDEMEFMCGELWGANWKMSKAAQRMLKKMIKAANDANGTAKDGTLHVSQFVPFCQRHAQLLFPALGLQRNVRSLTLGDVTWYFLARKRKKFAKEAHQQREQYICMKKAGLVGVLTFFGIPVPWTSKKSRHRTVPQREEAAPQGRHSHKHKHKKKKRATTAPSALARFKRGSGCVISAFAMKNEAHLNRGRGTDSAITDQLRTMGYSFNASARACLAVQNASVDAATQWLFQHTNDADLNDPVPQFGAALAADDGDDERKELLWYLSRTTPTDYRTRIQLGAKFRINGKAVKNVCREASQKRWHDERSQLVAWAAAKQEAEEETRRAKERLEMETAAEEGRGAADTPAGPDHHPSPKRPTDATDRAKEGTADPRRGSRRGTYTLVEQIQPPGSKERPVTADPAISMFTSRRGRGARRRGQQKENTEKSPERKRFGCRVCGKLFETPEMVEAHNTKKHPEDAERLEDGSDPDLLGEAAPGGRAFFICSDNSGSSVCSGRITEMSSLTTR